MLKIKETFALGILGTLALDDRVYAFSSSCGFRSYQLISRYSNTNEKIVYVQRKHLIFCKQPMQYLVLSTALKVKR